jgi:hypothetical protein
MRIGIDTAGHRRRKNIVGNYIGKPTGYFTIQNRIMKNLLVVIFSAGGNGYHNNGKQKRTHDMASIIK